MYSGVSWASYIFFRTGQNKYLLSLKILLIKSQIQMTVLVKVSVQKDQFFFFPAHFGVICGPRHESIIQLPPHVSCHLKGFYFVCRNESTDQALGYCGSSKVIGNPSNIFWIFILNFCTWYESVRNSSRPSTVCWLHLGQPGGGSGGGGNTLNTLTLQKEDPNKNQQILSVGT